MDYNDLPPFETPGGIPTPSAVETPDPRVSVDDDVDYDSYLESDDLDDGDFEPDGDENQDPDSDEGREPGSEDGAALKQQLREAQENLKQWELYNQQQEEVRLKVEQQKAEQHWDNALAAGNAQFAQREAALNREAEQMRLEFGTDRAEAWKTNEYRKLFGEYQYWLNDFHGQREASIWEVVKKAALPGYCAEVADYYGLPREAISQLLTYPPDLIPREAERMKRERDQRAAERRKATQLARRAKNLELGGKNVTPGSGRASGKEPELGSDDHYDSIPWQRA